MTMNEYQSRVLEAALECAARGWRVMPLHSIRDGRCTCGKADCGSPGKHPVTWNGSKDASADGKTIRRWFGSGRLLNIGIAAGRESGLVVLDVDPAHGGDSSIQRLSVPATLEVATGGGGRHFYFRYPQAGRVRNSVSRIAPGLDVRSDGGYVVAPPSVHISGHEYRWRGDPGAVDLAACPEWLLESAEAAGAATETAVERGEIATEGEPIPEGQRNAELTSLAGAMRRKGCSADEINAALIAVNKNRCRPPLGFHELQQIADSVSKYPPAANGGNGGGGVVMATGEILVDDDHADTVAEAFVAHAAEKYRFNCIDGWTVYRDGHYHRIAGEKEVGVLVRRFLRRCRYLKRVGDNEVVWKIRPTTTRIRDIIGALEALEGVHIPPEQHAPCWLTRQELAEDVIVLKNCMLDISGDEPKVLALTEDFYTLNFLPFDYDPQATCPVWLRFLGEIFTIRQDSGEYDGEKQELVQVEKVVPDELAAEILQEWFGYLVTHGTYLQKIFSIVGPRRSGKSTIGKVLRELVGSANTAAPTLTSLAKEFGLQPLMNKSLAIIGDAHLGGKSNDVTVAVERLKSISGEDAQQINPKNRPQIQVDKLGVRFLILGNEVQDLRDSSGALASRFTFLVTTESFLGNEDMALAGRLLAEIAGVFNWALVGLERLRERGHLQEHPASVESRADFEAMSAPLSGFVADWCHVGPAYSVPVDGLWRAQTDWAGENGREGYSKQKFASRIRAVVPRLKKERRRVDVSMLRFDYGVDIAGGDNRVNVYIGIDLKDEYKNRGSGVDTADRVWTK
ncbi:MAG TPA: bifunctional DNA primase/polymerase [Anaerohalosphaeraceae bacterium]|nr:bifunctional DNA primase/polymerase [Anaerohalosphaeraceae bacterium]HRT52282.1 bifunctional DNA primase/polymerase [Anaerohalosphaeraceae bacterium]HRT88391.1 bifunctional DNA primase/polymerase [Anaerohalosphaeraceae bacterium]